MKLTKIEVEQIVKDQKVKTGRGFYIIPVFMSERNSTDINGQQFWGLSAKEKQIFTKNVMSFFFFRNMNDVKEINSIIEN